MKAVYLTAAAFLLSAHGAISAPSTAPDTSVPLPTEASGDPFVSTQNLLPAIVTDPAVVLIGLVSILTFAAASGTD